MRYLKVMLFAALAVGAAAAFPAGVGFLPAGTEITELRDEVSRHYSNGDGTVTAVISAGPIHVRDKFGKWVSPDEVDDNEVSLPTFEYDYATGHASTDGSQYGKTGLGLVKVEREVSLEPPSKIERAGWAKFNLASLPEWARITGVSLYRVITYFEMHMGLSYRTLRLDPVSTGARTLYWAIQDGEVCYEGERGKLYDTIDLGEVGIQHVQQALAQKWVAFGIVGTGYSNIMTKRVWIIGWNVQPREHAPWLLVTYEQPSMVAEPGRVPGVYAVSVAPNPVTGGFAVLRFSGPLSQEPYGAVRILDAAGRCVRSQAVVPERSLVHLDLRGVQAGVYMVCLETAGDRLVGKVVVR